MKTILSTFFSLFFLLAFTCYAAEKKLEIITPDHEVSPVAPVTLDPPNKTKIPENKIKGVGNMGEMESESPTETATESTTTHVPPGSAITRPFEGTIEPVK